MKEYVERKALLENIKKYQSDAFGIPIIIAEIEKTPSADVREVIHAKWIDAYPEIEPNPMFMYGICSNCKFEQGLSSELRYCPECGAKMDLKETK